MNIVDLLTDDQEQQRKTRQVFGIVVGLVTNNQDPQGLGRIKVKFPWLSDSTESDWTKIMTFMAGQDRGAVFLPEVNDEVLVAFEHGDINFPYVLGGVWNSQAEPPEKNADGNNNVRKIRSRSGHEIIFRDDHTGRQEQIEIRSNGGHSVLLSDAAGAEQITIKDKTGGNYIEVDSTSNRITIKSSATLSIKSNVIEIESEGIMTIKASGALNIQGAIIKLN
jgi:uncharacterized protein involved in type VI secretion and phage assembly